jgi:hypothetical protein
MSRLLLKFQKTGMLAYLSHLETTRALERSLRRAGLPLAYTQGYSPHPRISCTPALPVGVGSLGEYMEVGLDRDVELAGLEGRINQSMPEDLRVLTAEMLPEHFPKMSRWIHYALYRVEAGQSGEAGRLLLALPLAAAGSESEQDGFPRLRDVLEKLQEQEGWGGVATRVTRQGLYASLDEIVEDAEGRLVEATGREARLREVKR